VINQSFWYELKLGEKCGIDSWNSVMRVPGGWVLSTPTSDVFIPFNNEFMTSAATTLEKEKGIV
jgi:hypothetical protein